jgi:hypothetical protein
LPFFPLAFLLTILLAFLPFPSCLLAFLPACLFAFFPSCLLPFLPYFLFAFFHSSSFARTS